MPEAGSPLQRFEAAQEAERQRPTANRSANRAAIDCVCPNEVTHTHFYLGVHFRMAQYQIGMRDLSLRLQKLSQSVRDVEPFVNAQGTALPVATTHWGLEELSANAKTLSPPDAPNGHCFDAVLTQSLQGLKAEKLVAGYTLESVPEPRLNGLLGHAFAFHVQRSMTLPHQSSGDFVRECTGAPRKELASTEILGIQLLVFVKAKVDGEVVIYKLIDGKLAGTVSADDYRREKLAEVIRHTCRSYWVGTEYGDLHLVPGVYTVTALLEDVQTEQPGSGHFRLVEVYCDGDCLYGPDHD